MHEHEYVKPLREENVYTPQNPKQVISINNGTTTLNTVFAAETVIPLEEIHALLKRTLQRNPISWIRVSKGDGKSTKIDSAYLSKSPFAPIMKSPHTMMIETYAALQNLGLGTERREFPGYRGQLPDSAIEKISQHPPLMK